MKKKTRTEDINSLEEAKAKAKTDEGKKHRAAILEMVYEQMKDPYLEKMRWALIDALKRADFVKMAEIRRKIEDYARSPQFIANQIKAAARISKKEAEVYKLKKEKEVRQYGR